MVIKTSDVSQVEQWSRWVGPWAGSGKYRARYGEGAPGSPWAGKWVIKITLNPSDRHNTFYEAYIGAHSDLSDAVTRLSHLDSPITLKEPLLPHLAEVLANSYEARGALRAFAYHYNNRQARILALASLALTATPPFLVSYHGTDAHNLPSIMQKGLQAQKPGGSGAYGVYMTSDMAKAARYAVEGTWSETSLPCILEIRLSQPKRVRKVYRDPLDRDEGTLYDNDYGADDDDMEYLARAIAKVTGLRSYALAKETGIKLETYGDPAALRGVNLYKPLIAWARKNNLNIQEFKQKLFAELTPGDEFGDYTLTDDGTLTLGESAYTGMHQQIYPDHIPPQAIKAVWLANVPANVPGERMSIQSKLLPQEVRHVVDTFGNISSSSVNRYELKDFDQLVERLTGKDAFNVYTDEIADIERISQAVRQAYDEDDDVNRFDGPYHEALGEARNEVADILENIASFAHEMLHNPPGGKTTEFTKLTPQEALQLAQKEKVYV